MPIGRETHHQTTQTLPHPHEIIFDILSRLTVMSLLRFRSVCKSWLSLISNPQFVKSHLSKTSYKGGDDDDDYTHHILVLNNYHSHTGLETTSYNGLKTCSLETLDSVLEYQLWENVVNLNCPFDDFNRFVVIVGSCNGLMCVALDSRALFLLNPSTRKSKRLPDSGVKGVWHPRDAYGFGFDESNDDYKVVLILYDRGGGFSVDSNVMVYTSRTDWWRKIGGFSCGIPFGVLGKFLNGSIHGVVCDNSGSSCSYVIVSIDLEKETYGVEKIILMFG